MSRNLILQKIDNIRESDDATKRRWLVAASAAAMIVVVALWIFSFNFLLLGNTDTSAVKDPGVSFFAIAGNGAGILWNAGMHSAVYGAGKIWSEISGQVLPERSIELNK